MMAAESLLARFYPRARNLPRIQAAIAQSAAMAVTVWVARPGSR